MSNFLSDSPARIAMVPDASVVWDCYDLGEPGNVYLATDRPSEVDDIVQLAVAGQDELSHESDYVGTGTSARVVRYGSCAVKLFEFNRLTYPDERGRASGLNAARVAVMTQVGLQRLEEAYDNLVGEAPITYVAPTMYGCYFPNKLSTGPSWIMSHEAGTPEGLLNINERAELPDLAYREAYLNEALGTVSAASFQRVIDWDNRVRNWLVRDSDDGKTLIKVDNMVKPRTENSQVWKTIPSVEVTSR